MGVSVIEIRVEYNRKEERINFFVKSMIKLFKDKWINLMRRIELTKGEIIYTIFYAILISESRPSILF